MEKEFFKKCRELIGQNKLEQVFELMMASAKDNNEKLNAINQFEGNFARVKRGALLGTISFDDEILQSNKIRLSVLEFLSIWEKESGGKEIILFIGASPADMAKLEIEKELNVVQLLTQGHEHLNVKSIIGAKKSDLLNFAIKYKPKILHFACHSNDMGIFLEAEDGSRNKAFLNLADFRNFISKWNRTIDCVVLNSCESRNIGDKIKEHIPNVVVMNQKVHDAAAIEYSKGFYNYLATENKNDPDFSKAHLTGEMNLRLLGLSDAFTVEFIKTVTFN